MADDEAPTNTAQRRAPVVPGQAGSDPLVDTVAKIARAIAERKWAGIDPEPVIATPSIGPGRADRADRSGGRTMGHTKWSEIKRRKGVDEAAVAEGMAKLRRAEAAWKASNQMVARGERPMYRVRAAGDGPEIRIQVVELPWLEATATRRSEVLRVGRAIVAEWLEVGEADFDVELAE